MKAAKRLWPFAVFGMMVFGLWLIVAEAKHKRQAAAKLEQDHQSEIPHDIGMGYCDGYVKKITEKTITVEQIPPLSDGTGLRTFELSQELASGDYTRVPSQAGHMYKIADARLGDRIQIIFYRKMGIEFCGSFCITRRPGGKVPKARYKTGYGADPFPSHEYYQALQDWEEKGIPIPYRYHPGDPRYPQLAPPPREVKH